MAPTKQQGPKEKFLKKVQSFSDTCIKNVTCCRWKQLVLGLDCRLFEGENEMVGEAANWHRLGFPRSSELTDLNCSSIQSWHLRIAAG
jgi:hypothetical protein